STGRRRLPWLTRQRGVGSNTAVTIGIAGMNEVATPTREAGQDFLRDTLRAYLASGRHRSVVTRFPPEPNGYLHIGHAKSICLNFGLAQEFGGRCHLRYDDTNPTKEDVEYVESIEHDVRWLGFAPSQVLFSADYFGKMYELAERLVREG